jgi:hypothetical protein
MKMNNLTDSTDSFIVKTLLKGMSKTYKRADIRRPITANDFSVLAYTFHVFTDKEFSSKLTKSSLKGSKIPWELQ